MYKIEVLPLLLGMYMVLLVHQEEVLFEIDQQTSYTQEIRQSRR